MVAVIAAVLLVFALFLLGTRPDPATPAPVPTSSIPHDITTPATSDPVLAQIDP